MTGRGMLDRGAHGFHIVVAASTGLLLSLAACAPAPERPAASAASETGLPKPDPAFTGTIGETYQDSKPSYPQPIRAPEGAPNVLLILLDDVGFGMAGTFGGPVPTPTLDRLAKSGLRYNTFHTTALCSPTRAALLAGRNHHSVGNGVITEMGTGFPGYTGIIPRSAALLPEMLRGNGYTTAAFGKWHNTPETEISPAGPFDRWPTGLGFDYFYGFNQGETDQYFPVLYRNTTPVDPPDTPEHGYHFGTDMTNETINWINNVHAADPAKPWFVYYSTGAVHAPHQVAPAWRERFAGQFDQGWDSVRAQTFERQKKMGIIPAGTRLTPRPAEIPAWDAQPANARRVYARLMENYAGYLAFTDDQIARIMADLERTGQLDNTLIIFIVGDNGASAEGGLEGTINETASLLGFQLGLASLISKYDEIGAPGTEPHVPVGWAWGMDSPFQWTKQIASHFGGTRNPMVISWPARIKDAGGLRSQFHHVIDVVPTVLEAAGIPAPSEVDGIPQMPIQGVSMLYTFDSAAAPSHRTVQYFEMLGNRGIYSNGWVATARHGRLPWENPPSGPPNFDKDKWELYHVDEDFSEANDIAAQNPDKLKELQAAFLVEAKKYDVLPLDDRFSERLDPANRVSGTPRTSWTYGNNARMAEPLGPGIWPRHHTVTATIDAGGTANGFIVGTGGEGGGWGLYALNGKLVYVENFPTNPVTMVRSTIPIPAGKTTVGAEVIPDGGHGKPATIKLIIDGKPAGEGRVPVISFRWGLEPFQVGRDDISPISPDYHGKGGFPFNRGIEEVKFDLVQ
ncbi:MAG: Sulfatase [Gemmatimonadetes bacterium]|nr:Sulfatase [Gemmatimonadota bacterium]